MVLAFGETDCEPLVDFVPLQPLLAVHEEALVELHESDADCPAVMDEGTAERAMVGT